MTGERSRIIELQRQLSIARKYLTALAEGYRDPVGMASEALEMMRPMDPKAPLQGLVGHERRPHP